MRVATLIIHVKDGAIFSLRYRDTIRVAAQRILLLYYGISLPGEHHSVLSFLRKGPSFPLGLLTIYFIAALTLTTTDAFGQNIESEWESGSMDGAIGTNSSASASLYRTREDLVESLM